MAMPLSSLHLEAFVSVAQEKSFSAAARRLFITQSALSQRVLNLEAEIEQTLIVRESSGLRLTAAGEKLLRYALLKDGLEKEVLSQINAGEKQGIAGHLKMGSFSSHVRSKLLPQVGRFHKMHPSVKIEVLTREIRELPTLLRSGEVDFIFTLDKQETEGLECIEIDVEENVLVEAKGVSEIPNVYIDHDEYDTTTFDFLRKQNYRNQSIDRIFFDEVYSIIDAVEVGLGRAVLPLHLVENRKSIKILKNFKPLVVPIYFCFYAQSYSTKLQNEWKNFILKSHKK